MSDNVLNQKEKNPDPVEEEVPKTENVAEEESKPVEEEPKNEETIPISSLIKTEVAQQIQEMGFSKNVSVKACLFTSSVLEQAIEWIYEHMNDDDFEQELKISKQEENKPKLTPEEVAKKARELQAQIRAKHLQKEKELAEEQERNRVRTAKEMAKAKQMMEEAEMKRYVEAEKQRKKEAEIAKRQMMEQLARDKEERFGKKFDPYTQTAEKKEYTPLENIQYYLNTIKTLYPSFRHADLCKNLYSTVKVILSNILKNPDQEKYRKVKTTNPNFQERLGKINLGMKVLAELGFEEDDEYLVVKEPDFTLFEQVVAFLEEEIPKFKD